MGRLNDFCPFSDICTECSMLSEDFDAKRCMKHPSLIGLFKQSYLPIVHWNDIALYPDDGDDEAFERLDEIRRNIVERVNTPRADNLIICGPMMGNGKTSWAIKIMQRYFAHIAQSAYMDGKVHGVFVPTSQFVQGAKDFSYGKLFHKYEEMRDAADVADIVVWDDVGAAEYSRCDYTNLLVPIERRIFAGKFNIFTMNFTECSDEFVGRVGERLANRIWTSSEVVEIYGEGLRQ